MPPAAPHMARDWLLGLQEQLGRVQVSAYSKPVSVELRAFTVTPAQGRGQQGGANPRPSGQAAPNLAERKELTSCYLPGSQELAFLPSVCFLPVAEARPCNLHFLFCLSHHRNHRDPSVHRPQLPDLRQPRHPQEVIRFNGQRAPYLSRGRFRNGLPKAFPYFMSQKIILKEGRLAMASGEHNHTS